MHKVKLTYDTNHNICLDSQYTDIRNEYFITEWELQCSSLTITLKGKDRIVQFVFKNVTYLKLDSTNFGALDNSLYLDEFKYCLEKNMGYGFSLQDGKPILFDSNIFEKISHKLHLKIETKNGLDFYFDSDSFDIEVV